MDHRLTLAMAGVAASWFAPARVTAHGGVGLPQLRMERPAAGEIMEARGGPVELRWTDFDPDDDANLVLSSQWDPVNPLSVEPLNSGMPEDCDPSDGGIVYTGTRDAGLGPAATALLFCGNPTGCSPATDCFPWTPGTMHPPGNYLVLGALDDDRGDGVGFDVAYARAGGVVRVWPADGGNVAPAVSIIEPDGVGDLVDTCFRARWNADDPDDNARLRVRLQRVDAVGEVLVAADLREDDDTGGMELDLSGLPDPSEWLLHVEISDGVNPAWLAVSPGRVIRYTAGARDGGCAPRAVPDAGPAGDGGAPVGADAGNPTDGGGGTDAASPDAGEPGADAGMGMGWDAGGRVLDGGASVVDGGRRDAGDIANSDGSQAPAGRGCRARLVDGSPWPWAPSVLLALAIMRARRRR